MSLRMSPRRSLEARWLRTMPSSTSSVVTPRGASTSARASARASVGALAGARAEVEAPRGVTTDDVLEGMVRSQRASKLRLGDILKDMGLVSEEQICLLYTSP